MLLESDEKITEVHSLNEEEKKLACAFIQGAVYAWLGTNPDKSFAVRDLFGGSNTYAWKGTPLYPLWDNLHTAGKNTDEAFEQAAKDVGRLLKAVLAKDKRKFSIERVGMSNRYLWMQDE